MLFFMGTLVSVLLGIDIFAQILGDGPLAYFGGLIGAGGFLFAYKLSLSQLASVEIAEKQGDSHPTPSPLPPEILESWAETRAPAEEEPSATRYDAQGREKRSHRRRRHSRKEPLTMLERFKAFARSIGG